MLEYCNVLSVSLLLSRMNVQLIFDTTSVLFYASSREPVAREPSVTLLKTASDSLARKQILANFLQSIAQQRIPQERLAQLTTDGHIAPLVKLVLIG